MSRHASAGFRAQEAGLEDIVPFLGTPVPDVGKITEGMAPVLFGKSTDGSGANTYFQVDTVMGHGGSGRRGGTFLTLPKAGFRPQEAGLEDIVPFYGLPMPAVGGVTDPMVPVLFGKATDGAGANTKYPVQTILGYHGARQRGGTVLTAPKAGVFRPQAARGEIGSLIEKLIPAGEDLFKVGEGDISKLADVLSSESRAGIGALSDTELRAAAQQTGSLLEYAAKETVVPTEKTLADLGLSKLTLGVEEAAPKVETVLPNLAGISFEGTAKTGSETLLKDLGGISDETLFSAGSKAGATTENSASSILSKVGSISDFIAKPATQTAIKTVAAVGIGTGLVIAGASVIPNLFGGKAGAGGAGGAGAGGSQQVYSQADTDKACDDAGAQIKGWTDTQATLCKQCNATIGATSAELLSGAGKGASVVTCMVNASKSSGTGQGTGQQNQQQQQQQTPGGKAGQNTTGACDSTYSSDAATAALCKSCGGDSLDTSDATAVTAWKTCMQQKGAADTTTPTNPGGSTTSDPCSGLSGNQLTLCQGCQQKGFTTNSDLALCIVCQTQITDPTQQQTCLACIQNGGGSITQADLVSCVNGGGAAAAPGGGGASSAEQAAMATDVANGSDPCADSTLSADTAAACKACYTAGMASTDLITCVQGKLGTTGTTATGIVGTIEKYKVPLAVAAVVVGVVVVGTHGKLWGKKGGKPPVKAVVKRTPVQRKNF